MKGEDGIVFKDIQRTVIQDATEKYIEINIGTFRFKNAVAVIILITVKVIIIIILIMMVIII